MAYYFIASHISPVDGATYAYAGTWSREQTTVTWKAVVRRGGEVVAELKGTCHAIGSEQAAVQAVKAFVARAIDQFASNR
jgi:hypothetical protein